jgi:septum formation protein
MNNILLLASKSKSRRFLLSQAEIPYVLLDHEADEKQCDWGMHLQKLVESIALHKMAQIAMPHATDEKQLFVLTADTLTQNARGDLLGKPQSRDDAMAMLRSLREGSARVGTAFCLDKKVFKYDQWQTSVRKVVFVDARCDFKVPEHWVERYLNNSHALNCSGSMAIDDYGAQFLHTIQGSYTTILGLPMSQLRNALEEMGFF